MVLAAALLSGFCAILHGIITWIQIKEKSPVIAIVYFLLSLGFVYTSISMFTLLLK